MLRTTNPASTREREYGRRRAVVSNPTGATPSGRPILTWTPTARHPSDPDWLHDTDADLAPEVDR